MRDINTFPYITKVLYIVS